MFPTAHINCKAIFIKSTFTSVLCLYQHLQDTTKMASNSSPPPPPMTLFRWLSHYFDWPWYRYLEQMVAMQKQMLAMEQQLFDRMLELQKEFLWKFVDNHSPVSSANILSKAEEEKRSTVLSGVEESTAYTSRKWQCYSQQNLWRPGCRHYS